MNWHLFFFSHYRNYFLQKWLTLKASLCCVASQLSNCDDCFWMRYCLWQCHNGNNFFFLLAFFSLLAVDWNIFFFALLAALCCQIESAGVAWRGYFMGSVGTLWWPSHLHKSWHTNTLWKGGPNGPEGAWQPPACRFTLQQKQHLLRCSCAFFFFILFAFLFLYVYMQSGHKICKNF